MKASRWSLNGHKGIVDETSWNLTFTPDSVVLLLKKKLPEGSHTRMKIVLDHGEAAQLLEELQAYFRKETLFV